MHSETKLKHKRQRRSQASGRGEADESESERSRYSAIKHSSWFDADFYLNRYPDVALADMDPARHYLLHGAAEGRQPHPQFDVGYYRAQCAIHGLSIDNPLLHYLEFGEALGLSPSNNFTGSISDTTVTAREFERWIVARELDYQFYLSENEDVDLAGIDPVRHYIETGWREGRNPTPYFDTLYYLSSNEDVAASGVNPFFHFLVAGRSEGRPAAEGVLNSDTQAQDSPSLRAPPDNSQDLFVRELVSSEFDLQYYVASFREPCPPSDPIGHYLERGWREGLNPSAEFDTTYYLLANPDVRQANVNPFFHYLAAGRAEGRRGTPENDEPIKDSGASTASVDEFEIRTIAAEFDTEYYLEQYGDVAEAGVDPVRHYASTGWREGRNPCWQFDTNYYLISYSDVRDAGINPFFHYLVAGRAEGRSARDKLAIEVNVLAASVPPSVAAKHWTRQSSASGLTKNVFRLVARQAIRNSRGFCLAFSHDNYVDVVGGIQNCINDEQISFNEAALNYVQVYPSQPLPMLSEEKSVDLCMTLNGKPIANLPSSELLKLLAQLAPLLSGGKSRFLIIHSLLGHSTEFVTRAARKLKISQSFFWLHDYSSLCESFTLLRNDVSFCRAPALDSQACTVCAYGATRGKHVQRYSAMFRQILPVVLAPSEAALCAWRQEGFGLSTAARLVVPHTEYGARRKQGSKQTWKESGKQSGKEIGTDIRVGFLGYDKFHKGWATFQRLAQEYNGDGYSFYHLGRRHSRVPFIKFNEVNVTREDRHAMVRAVHEHLIDIVVIWPAWPETYSFVAYEAIAAGALVVTHEGSGNVAAAVRESNAGVVLRNEDELFSLFPQRAFRRKLLSARQTRNIAELNYSGCTAAVFAMFQRDN